MLTPKLPTRTIDYWPVVFIVAAQLYTIYIFIVKFLRVFVGGYYCFFLKTLATPYNEFRESDCKLEAG